MDVLGFALYHEEEGKKRKRGGEGKENNGDGRNANGDLLGKKKQKGGLDGDFGSSFGFWC